MALTEYAKGRGCWACNLPPDIRQEIDEVRRATGIGPDQVIKWLIREKGYAPDQIRRGSLNNHFVAGHHESR
jgi:hypothetical protein